MSFIKKVDRFVFYLYCWGVCTSPIRDILNLSRSMEIEQGSVFSLKLNLFDNTKMINYSKK